MNISIPYGKKQVTVSIHEKNLLGVLHPKRSHSKNPEPRVIKEAILNPMGCCRLKDLVSPKETVAIVVPDLTRRCPRELILPILLDELNRGGIKDRDITIFMAIGMHRPLTKAEIGMAFGKSVVKRVKIKNHDPVDKSNLTHLGYVSGGVPAVVNKELMYKDHVIAVGVIEPHLYAGFSGGPKTLSIGMAGEETISFTHSPKFLDKPGVRLGGIKDNPFHRVIMEVACIAKLKFMVKEKNPATIVRKMRGRRCAAGEQRTYMVAKSLTYADCAMVGTKIPHIVNKMHMLHFRDFDEALKYAFATRGKDAKIYVVPHALVTLPVSR